MKNLFLFVNVCRATMYGIGTYLEQMKFLLENDKEQIRINIVYLHSNCECVEVSYDNAIRVIKIPYSQYIIRGKEKIYYKNIAFILYPFLIEDVTSKNILHFNFIEQIEMLEMLKKLKVDFSSYFTVHFLDSLSAFNGCYYKYKEFLSERNQADYILNYISMERCYLHKVDKIITLNNTMFDLLRSFYNISLENLCYIPNVAFKKIKLLSIKDQERIKLEIGVPLHCKIILYVGRLDSLKNVKMLFDVINRFKGMSPDFMFVIVGDDRNDFDLLRYSSQRNVLFTGFLTKQKLENIYRISDLGISLSATEQCSFSTLEMISNNIPLILLNTDENKQLSDIYSGISLINFRIIDGCPELNCEELIYLLKNVVKAKAHLNNQLDVKRNICFANIRYKEVYQIITSR